MGKPEGAKLAYTPAAGRDYVLRVVRGVEEQIGVVRA